MKEIRSKFLEKTKERLRTVFKSRDMLVGHLSRTIDELDDIINILGERLEEWYGVYFPELKLEDKVDYAKVAVTLDRQNPNISQLAQAIGAEKAKKIAAGCNTSLGVNLPESDLNECKALAEKLISLYELRAHFLDYEEHLTKEVCPNIAHLAGSDIAAKLIAHVGTLSRLAFLPASTIQVIGAEKALFKHLKNRRIAPPKHGILFLHPKISSNAKRVRGKIARALANKIALAAKADAFTKNFIADKLKQDFEQRYNEIMQQYQSKKGKENQNPVQ